MTAISVGKIGISDESCAFPQGAHTQVVVTERLAEFADTVPFKQIDIRAGVYLVFKLTGAETVILIQDRAVVVSCLLVLVKPV